MARSRVKRTESLSERERRFVEFYMGEAAGNATKAALLAGYAKTTAEKQASRLLGKVGIQKAIEERSKSDPAVMNREERQAFWTRIALDESVSMRERLKASELLAKSQGDFIEKRLLRLEGNGTPTLIDILDSIKDEYPQGRPGIFNVTTGVPQPETPWDPPQSDDPLGKGHRRGPDLHSGQRPVNSQTTNPQPVQKPAAPAAPIYHSSVRYDPAQYEAEFNPYR